eukprot:GCRY01001195.1.p1 GENE.GCRY01001195.1~~GCRY01001195.1.p1  ORF type:complete len:440 (+),score=108.65 GCRY01001195.1:860-2179(+)
MFVKFRFEPYVLKLKNEWGTSHSSTTERTNFLVSLFIGNESLNLWGFGECGLPPKKKDCYYAEFSDCLEFAKQYMQAIAQKKLFPFSAQFVDLDGNCELMSSSDSSQTPPNMEFLAFDQVPENLFTLFREDKSETSIVFHQLLALLDQTRIEGWEKVSRPCRCAVEMAVLDGWGKSLSVPLFRAIGLSFDALKPTFVTTSLKPKLEDMFQEVDCLLEQSSFLKIKVDGSVSRTTEILSGLDKRCPANIKWSIDANAAWTLPTFRAMLPLLRQYAGRIYMLEQPHPLGFERALTAGEAAEWVQLREACEDVGILLFADESFNDVTDIPRLKPFFSGVNAKLEKCGGIRGAVAALTKAQEEGLKTWIGLMVSSALNTSAASHLLPLTHLGGDVDGVFIVADESSRFHCAFEMDNSAGARGYIRLKPIPGVGAVLKDQGPES